MVNTLCHLLKKCIFSLALVALMDDSWASPPRHKKDNAENYGNVTITPTTNDAYRKKVLAFRSNIEYLFEYPQGKGCGIMWTLASLNGSTTDYHQLSRIGRGEGRLRLLAVVHEVLASASRVKTSLAKHGRLPPYCHIEGGFPKVQLALFVDRDIIVNLNEHNLTADVHCLFDKIIYFDQLPSFHDVIEWRDYKKVDMLVRLAPRPNAMKLLSFFSTPFHYTLYLDGDVAPCFGFQSYIFSKLAHRDVLTTPNPFGYQSTNGLKVYQGAPDNRKFAEFVEVNGGVFAFRWNTRTQDLFMRTLELIPFFAKLGFDQDQAMMRHALFEATALGGLTVHTGTMDNFCRHGWSCEKNDCKLSCILIHQRMCTHLGVNVVAENDKSSCGKQTGNLADRAGFYHAKNFRINTENRRNRAKILKQQ